MSVQSKFIEAINRDGDEVGNWGKFMVGRFSEDEWQARSSLDPDHRLLPGRGWSHRHILVWDLETGEGAIFLPFGVAAADLHKHRVWVCPMFEPFLSWLYQQDLDDLEGLPSIVELSFKDAPFAMSGYRREGPEVVDRRQRLLGWVQAHFIQRYSDKSVVSHSEAVEELEELIRGK